MGKRRTIRISLMCLLAVFSLGACKDNSQKLESSYSATTIDECINEKDCVWHAFSSLVTRIKPSMQSPTNEEYTVRKWLKPIQASFVSKDEDTQHYYDYLQKIGNDIQPFFPYDMKQPNSPNVLIFYSRNFVKDLEGDYRSLAYQTVTQALGKEGYKNFIKMNDDECFSLLFKSSETLQEIVGSIIFIHPDKKVEQCLTTKFMMILGLDSHLKGFPFSVAGGKHNNFTKLDLFMIELLYNSHIKPGMSLVTLRKIFDDIYAKTLKSFNNKVSDS